MKIYSRLYFFMNTGFLIGLVGLAAACTKPNKQNAQEIENRKLQGGSATFYLEKVDAHKVSVTKTEKYPFINYANGGRKDEAQWLFPQIKRYALSVCVKENQSRQSLPGREFEVIGGPSAFRAAADGNGCFNWTEDIRFDALADPKYLIFERTLRAVSGVTGERPIKIAINPWSGTRPNSDGESEDAVVDLLIEKNSLSKNNLVEGQENVLRALGSPADLRKTWVDVVPTEALHKPGASKGVNMVYTFTLEPKVRVKNINGDWVLVPIRSGRYLINAWVVSKTGLESKKKGYVLGKYVANASTSKNGFPVDDGKIFVELPMHLVSTPTIGQVEIALRLTPLPGASPSRLGSFEGVFVYGHSGEIQSSQFMPAKSNENGMRSNNSSYLSDAKSGQTRSWNLQDDYLSELEDLVDAEQTAAQAGKVPSGKPGTESSNGGETYRPNGLLEARDFQFKKMSFRYLGLAPGETATSRVVNMAVSSCVTSAVDYNTAMRNIDFEIKFHDGRTIIRKTDAEGCLSWIEKFEHFYYASQDYAVRSVQIRPTALKREYELKMAVNPWSPDMALDLCCTDVGFLEEYRTRAPQKSLLLLTNASYGLSGPLTYTLDKSLNLTINKTVDLQLAPEVLQYGSIQNGSEEIKPLRDGIYLLKVALQKDFYKDMTAKENKGEYLSVVRRLVFVRANKITYPVEFSFRDWRLAQLTGQILIELAPVDEKKLATQTQFVGTAREDLLKAQRWIYALEVVSKKTKNADPALEYIYQDLMNDPGIRERLSNLGAASRLDIEIRNAYKARETAESGLDRALALEYAQDLKTSAAASDLDSLVADAQTVGLGARTFVGRIDMKNQVNQGSVWPTDELAENGECSTRDCDSVRAVLKKLNFKGYMENPEQAKYFGSLGSLRSVTVSSLFTKYLEQEKRYQKNILNLLSFDKFLRAMNLDIVFVQDAGKRLLENPLLSANNALQTAAGNDFIDLLNRDWPRVRGHMATSKYLSEPSVVTSQTLHEMIDSGQIPGSVALRLCPVFFSHYFINQHRQLQKNGSGFYSSESYGDTAASYCMRQTQTKTSMFIAEKKVRILDVETYKPGNGYTMRFSVGSDVGVSNDSGFVKVQSGGLSLSTGISNILGVSLNYARTWSASESRALTSNYRIATEKALDVFRKRISVRANKTESCVAIRLNPRNLDKALSERYLHSSKSKDPQIQNQERNRIDSILSRGILICDGDESDAGMDLSEDYFYMTDLALNTGVSNAHDIQDTPWLLNMRGMQTFRYFMQFAKARPDSASNIGELGDLTGYPTEKLEDIYNAFQQFEFKQVTPPYPGIYTPVDEPARSLNH